MDVFDTPPNQRCITKRYTGGFRSTGIAQPTLDWHTWTRPLGHSMLAIFAIGGGAGAGGGRASAAGSNFGGGGGGSSSTFRAIYLLDLLPDTLYIQVGGGGLGGAGGTNASGSPGADGSNAYVSIYPNSTPAENHIAVANSVPGQSGGGGTTAAGGGGTAGQVITPATYPLMCWALSIATTAGQAGKNGSIGPSFGATAILGGGGGSANNVAGAGFSPVANVPYATVPGAAIGTPGGHGFMPGRIPVHFPGFGGGGGPGAGNGADGGFGVTYGSGGGGGGGVTSAGTGGRGGEGGPGLVIMTSW